MKGNAETMDEKLLAKIREVLKKHGLEEEEISEVETELKGEAPAEETPADPVEETPAPAEETPAQEEDTTPKSEEVPSASEGDVDPAEPAKDESPVEGELPPADNQPVAPETPIEEEVPQGEPASEEAVVPSSPLAPTPDVVALVGELQGKLEEANKTIEGLTSRIDSLQAALKTAGIMEDTPSSPSAEVGIDDTTRTPGFKEDEGADLDEVMERLNKFRR